jgi:hypothetical protein
MLRNDDAPATRCSRASCALLALLVVVALAARVWGSFLGLPHAYLPDETAKLALAESLPGNGFRTGGNQPGFLPLSLLAVRQATRALEPSLQAARLPGGNSLDDPSGVAARLWIARLWLGVLSAATVPIVFLLARRLGGVAAGLIAAALLALDPLAIASAGYVKEDTPLALWLAATTLAVLELGRRRTARAALVAGATAGLALGSKYVGVLALPLVVIAPWIRPDAAPAGAGRGDAGAAVRDDRAGAPSLLVLAAVACVLALLATTPALVVDPLSVVRGVGFQAGYAATGHHDGIALPITETWGVLYLRAALLPTLGLPALGAALVGLLALLRHDRGAGVLLAAGTFGLLLVVEVLPAKPYPFFARYALPAIPGLCALAGVGCVHVAAWLAGRRRATAPADTTGTAGTAFGPTRAPWLAAVAAAVVAWPLVVTVRFTRSMYPDTRDRAARWLLDNAAPGDWVLATPYAPVLPSGRFRTWPLANEPGARRILEQQPAVKYIVLSEAYTGRFADNPDDAPGRAAFLAWLTSRSEEVARFAAPGPRFGFFQPTISVRRLVPSPGAAMGAPHPPPDTVDRDPGGAVSGRHEEPPSPGDRPPRREPATARGLRAERPRNAGLDPLHAHRRQGGARVRQRRPDQRGRRHRLDRRRQRRGRSPAADAGVLDRERSSDVRDPSRAARQARRRQRHAGEPERAPGRRQGRLW